MPAAEAEEPAHAQLPQGGQLPHIQRQGEWHLGRQLESQRVQPNARRADACQHLQIALPLSTRLSAPRRLIFYVSAQEADKCKLLRFF